MSQHHENTTATTTTTTPTALLAELRRREREPFSWCTVRETVDVDGETVDVDEQPEQSGSLADLVRALDGLGAIEPSCSPLGDSPDGSTGYRPWFSAIDHEPNFRTGERSRYSVHVRRNGRPIGETTARRILRALGR